MKNSKTHEVQFLLWRNCGLLRNKSCRESYILICLLRARPFSYPICNPYMVWQASVFVPILCMGNQRLKKAIPTLYKVKTGKEVGPQSLFSVPGVTQPHTTDSETWLTEIVSNRSSFFILYSYRLPLIRLSTECLPNCYVYLGTKWICIVYFQLRGRPLSSFPDAYQVIDLEKSEVWALCFELC